MRTLSALAVLALSTACYAQTCALCYTQAASAGSRIIQGLRSGILVLVIPPMFMSVGITLLAYKKRNQFSRADDSQKDHVDGSW
ncbi:MAG: hypothetical protein WA628_07605 [Terriglobales bacterium]